MQGDMTQWCDQNTNMKEAVGRLHLAWEYVLMDTGQILDRLILDGRLEQVVNRANMAPTP